MIKAGGYENEKIYTDDKFAAYYKGAVDAGLHVGAYIYIGDSCDNMDKANKVANYFAGFLKEYDFDMPISVDVEEYITFNTLYNCNIVNTICANLESKVYYVTIYGSESNTFDGILSAEHTAQFDRWVAKYGYIMPELACGMWQYSRRFMVDGINGYVDVNASFKNYPQIIKNMKERKTK